MVFDWFFILLIEPTGPVVALATSIILTLKSIFFGKTKNKRGMLTL